MEDKPTNGRQANALYSYYYYITISSLLNFFFWHPLGCFLWNIIIIHLFNCTNETAYNCVCIIHKLMKEKWKQYILIQKGVLTTSRYTHIKHFVKFTQLKGPYSSLVQRVSDIVKNYFQNFQSTKPLSQDQSWDMNSDQWNDRESESQTLSHWELVNPNIETHSRGVQMQ